MFCDKCGTFVPDGDAFCPECGNRVAPAAGASVPRNTGYVNMSGRYAQAPYAQRPPYGQAAMAKPKKKGPSPVVIGAIAAVAVIAVAALLIFNKPYMKPIDKLYKAYNKNDLSLLQEALSDDLYHMWNKENILYNPHDDSYKVLSKQHVKSMAYKYGGTDCYTVTVRDTTYKYQYGTYETDVFAYVVCKVNGKWKIVDFE